MSSDYFLAVMVTYSNQSKQRLLGVDPDLISSDGAVSESVARAMAQGVTRAVGSDIGVAITGIASPGGGSELKPTWTVHVALGGPSLDEHHRCLRLPGERWLVRRMASQWALEILRRALLRRRVV